MQHDQDSGGGNNQDKHEHNQDEHGKDTHRKGQNTALIAFAGGVLATLLIALVTVMAVVYSGAYNIAASEQHRSFVRWALDTNFHRSVENSARGLAAPESITPEMIAEGGEHYKETCAICHGGPGEERAQWADGMRPSPPELTEAAAEWQINEIFWLAKHGVRMTGMPAFGSAHDDATLWGIAAFVKELPAMTPEEYQAIGPSAAQAVSETQ